MRGPRAWGRRQRRTEGCAGVVPFFVRKPLVQTLSVSHRASRRAMIAGLIGNAGTWLTVGVALGVGAVGAWKIFPEVRDLVEWWVLLAVPAGLGALVAAVTAAIDRWNTLGAARRL